MVTRKSRAEIDKMRRAGRIVAEVLAIIEEALKPGVSTAELDRLAEEHILRSGAIPSFKGYPGINPRRPFPASVCISIDDEIVHGIPGERTIRAGQIVSVDAGAILDGWHGDAARTFYIGDPPPAIAELIDTTRAAMLAGIAAAVPGDHIEDISAAVEDVAAPEGLRHHPPVRRPRDRHRHARGAAGPQLPDRAARPEAGARDCAWPSSRCSRSAAHEAHILADDWTVVHRRRLAGRAFRGHHRRDRARSRDPDGPMTRLPGSRIFDTLRVRVSAQSGRHCA